MKTYLQLLPYSLILAISSVVLGCEDANEANNTTEQAEEVSTFCPELFYGQFEYEAPEGYRIVLNYGHGQYSTDKVGFRLAIEVGEESYSEGVRYVQGFRAHPNGRFDDQEEVFQFPLDALEEKNSITVKSATDLDMGSDVYMEESKIEISYLNPKTLELRLNGLEEWIGNFLDKDITASGDRIVLKRISGPSQCWGEVAESIGLNDAQDEYLYLEMRKNSLEIVESNLLKAYCFNEHDGWPEHIQDLFRKYGRSFSLDVNEDGQFDFGCYLSSEYSNDGTIWFKLFVHNGVVFDEVYSDMVSDDHLAPVYFPDQLNGKTVLSVNYVHKELTNYLYFNQRTGRMEEYLTD